MEYLILLAALLAVGFLFFLKGLYDSRKRYRWQKEKVRQAFGKAALREYEPGEFESLCRYFERHRKEHSLDDITWNDLNMDEVFRQMNLTFSSAGQEYLYYMLRTPCQEEGELLLREELMDAFCSHEEERVNLQMLFFGVGRTGKYSLYDYLDFLSDLGERNSGLTILLDLLFIPAVALIAWNPSYGLLMLIVLLGFNISTYMKEKRTIEPYLISFQYVMRTLGLAEGLAKADVPFLEREQEKIKKLLPAFGKLKRSAAFGMRNMGDGGNPLDILLDYLNMMFHFDILGFNRMLHQLRTCTDQIDELLTVTGRIEALIAAAGYRESLPARCRPVFKREGLFMRNLYHPLLKDPVKNDILAQRGVLLTGSNASGKSTFLKSVAVNAVLAQTIYACCADAYEGSFFRIMTSMALRDDLEGGESYYIVEIRSIKRILDAVQNQTMPVLCFVDEVLRGTNTVERIAASTQILKSLARTGVYCFAATHDIELTHLLEKEYDNYHFEEEIADDDIYFPYKLLKGRATTRNAIRLLSVMGYDEKIIGKAQEMAGRFTQTGRWS